MSMNVNGINFATNGGSVKKAGAEQTAGSTGSINFKFGADNVKENYAGLSLERTTTQAAASQNAEDSGKNEGTSYSVKEGDSLWGIAKQQLVDAGEKPTPAKIIEQMRKISDANNLELSKDLKNYKPIHKGDELMLPPIGGEDKAEQTTPVDSAKPSPEPPQKPDKKDSIKNPPVQQPLTPEERRKAREFGDNTADYLVGYTTDAEQGLVKNVITKNVNARNVMDFLAGYEENKGFGDSFFEQLHSENDFPEKQNLLKNVASKLSRYLKSQGQSGLAREVDIILSNNGFSKKDAARLDEIVKTMLTNIPGLKI